MKISEDHISGDGGYYIFEYFDADTFRFLDRARCKQAYSVCFSGDKIVVASSDDRWNLVGGPIEGDESPEDALKRAVRGSGLEIEKLVPIGYLRLTDMLDGKEVFQLQYVCRVKRSGDLAANAKFVDPAGYKGHLGWGKIGERIIGRALELKEALG